MPNQVILFVKYWRSQHGVAPKVKMKYSNLNPIQYCVTWLSRVQVYIYRRCIYPKLFGRPFPNFSPIVEIGRHTYGITKKTIFNSPALCKSNVKVGNFCSIGPGVIMLIHAEHPTNLATTFPLRTLMYPGMGRRNVSGCSNLDAFSGPIEIGHDVWIGQNALILSGLSIGTGAIVAAGSIVTKDVPPYGIVAGNPAKLVRFRFSEDVIQQFLNSVWWDLEDDEILKLEPYFYSEDVDKFLIQVDNIKKTKCN